MRWWSRTPWLFTLGALVVLVTSAAAQGPAIIEPGHAIGAWTLDTPLTDLRWNLGLSSVQSHVTRIGPEFRSSVEVAVWDDPPTIAIFYPGDVLPAALGTTAWGYATRKQVGIGTEESKVTAAYGDPSAIIQLPGRPRMLIYNTLGVVFQIAYDIESGKYGSVERVFVFRPGKASGIWRTP